MKYKAPLSIVYVFLIGILISFSSIGQSLPEYVSTNGLVGWWPFNGNANDLSGHGNNGTVNGAVLVSDRNGNQNKAYSFNGSSSYIEIQDNATLDLSNKLTLSAWFYAAGDFDVDGQAILGKGLSNTVTGYALQFMPSDAGIGLQSNNNSTSVFTSNQSLVNNGWHHIVGTYNGTKVCVYIDGELVSTANYTIILDNSSTPLYFGKELLNFRYFNGKIDDIGIWNRSLSQAEINNLYHSKVIPPVDIQSSNTTICEGETTSLSVALNLPEIDTSFATNFGISQEGLVGYWDFNNSSDNKASTSAQTTYSNLTYTFDRNGNPNSSGVFNDLNHYVQMSLPKLYNFTVSFWLKNNNPSDDYGRIISTADDRLEVATDNNGDFKFYMGYNWNDVQNIGTQNWEHIVLRRNGTSLKIYINSELIETYQVHNDSIPSLWDLGQRVNSVGGQFGYFNLDELLVFSRLLTNSEIEQLYQQSTSELSSTVTYEWSTGEETASIDVSPSVTTTYYCEVKQYGLSHEDSIKITVNPFTEAISGVVSVSDNSQETVCYGQSKNLKVEGSVGTIQWQYSTSTTAETDTTGWLDILGGTNNIINRNEIVKTTSYRVLVKNGECSEVISNVLTISLASFPGIISGSSALCTGNTGTTLTLNDALGTISWQKSTNYSAATPTWTSISNASASTYTTPSLTVSTAYRTKVTCGNTSAYSTSFPIEVNKKSIGGKAALYASSSYLVCKGGSKSLKLSGYTGTIQWQKGSSSSGPWVDVEGATNTVQSFLNITENSWFRAKVSSGSCNTAFSNVIALVVREIPISGTLSAAATTLCSGSGTTLTLDGSSGGTIAWQKSINISATTPIWSTVSGSTSSLSISSLTKTTAYRAVLTNSPCPISVADYVLITVSPKSVAGTVTYNGSSNSLVCSGGSKSLKVTGNVGTIQWQTASSQIESWTDIDSADSMYYNIDSVSSSAFYRVKVTSGICPSVNSGSLAITVKQPTLAGSISGTESTLCKGSGSSLTLSGYTGTITWKKSINYNSETPTWTIVAGTSETLSTGSLSASTAFKAILTNSPCPTSTTGTFVISVDPKVIIKKITANATVPEGTTSAKAICPSTSKTLTLGSGYVGTIQWQRASAIGGPWTDLDGQNSATYTISSPTLGANYFRVKLSSGVCASGTTTPIVVYYKVCTPSIATVEADSITAISAKVGCTILNNGLANITAKGICYGTSENPTIAGTKTSDGTGSDNFTSLLTGLLDNTNYYARAYATNSAGTVYGNQINFKTDSIQHNSSLAISTSSNDIEKMEVLITDPQQLANNSEPNKEAFLTVPSLIEAVAYPNPFDSHFSIMLSTFSEEQVQIKILDMLGKVIELYESDPALINGILLGNTLCDGEYILQITQGAEQRFSRIVKR